MKRFLILILILSFTLTLLAREPLTFEQRVKAQEAIEKVYYNHRIWPKENKTPKPAFEKMVSKETIEAKVTDYLKKSAALEKYWYRPITGEQLQAEMDRMAKGTKDPATLNELFEALNNDPYLIAECLARPVLADRLIRNWYANDKRFHKETREKAEDALKQLTPENFCSYPEGQYSKINYRLELEGRDEMERLDLENHSIGLDEKEFSKMFQEIPEEGKISGVIEEDDCFVILHTIEKKEVGIVVEGITFKKVSTEEWLKDQQESRTILETEGNVSMSMPPVMESGCVEGWAEQGTIYEWCPTERRMHTAVWTGTEMIIWGGLGSNITGTGGKYNPSTDSWTETTLTNAAGRRNAHTAVWTGSEMIVWGGWNGSNCLDTGGKYDPSSNSWEITSVTNAPAARADHTAVWSGTEMIIWGGDYIDGIPIYLNTGGRYNPSNNSWTATSTSNAPSARSHHTAVWTNTEMIIWGGSSGSSPSNSGAKYRPSTDNWTATSTIGAPEARLNHTAVWTGTEMIIWGGAGNGNYLNTGGKYKPSLNSWVETTTSNAPDARWNHTAIWTGTKMIIWGGSYSTSTDILLDTGGSYNDSNDSWNPTTTTNAPSPRSEHTAVWTGSEMIIWGGLSLETPTYRLNTGAKYALASDSWVPTNNTTESPDGRSSHTAVWTGTEMIIWGGYDDHNRLQTGGRFNLSTDNWVPTAVVEAPSGRMYHTAVWTGSEMIVWGGHDGSNSLNTGGKYNPITDLWITVPTSAAPIERMGHTAVWTGTEMIVWGGENGTIRLNTGSRYNPLSENWIPMTTTDAPSARIGHRGIWIGNEMIVWGGINGSSYFNTGGRYSPSTDSWIATSTTGVPAGRGYHTAVWTGTEMIIWGGLGSGGNYLSTGGRYTPSTNSWIQTATSNAPVVRYNHTAVWTGSEMIVWGGCGNAPTWKNDGGKYDPSLNSWISTPFGMNCPSGRNLHSAIWTGSEMIIWGGYGNGICYGSGAIYYFPNSPAGVNSEAEDNEGCLNFGVLVEWNLPYSWGDGSSGIRSFDVLRNSVQIAGDLSDSTTSYIDTTGSNGISYLYQVRADNGCGLSATTAGTSAMDFVCTWNLLYQSHGTFTEVTGDGDGYFEKGEKWSVPVTVTNSGNTPATDVTAVLSGNGIAVCDSTGSFGTIAAGGTGTFTYNFVIDDDFIPCGGNINFNLGSKACTELTPAGTDETNLFSIQVGQIAVGDPTDLILQPSTADSYVNQASAGTNYGSGTTMSVQSKLSQAQRTLVMFDLSAIPEDSTINSATLELYASSAPTTGLTLNVHRITGTWTEAGVTWTNQPAYNSTVGASLAGGTTTGWKIWNIASLVQGWVDGTSVNYGIVVKGSVENDKNALTYAFASKENATTTYRPILRINYTPPTTISCDYVGLGECETILAECAPGNTYENGQAWSGTSQSWPALSGATGYKLYRGVQSGLQYLLTADNDSCLRYEGITTSVDLSSDDPSGETGRLYWYIVVGTNASGEGPAGNGRIVNSSGNCE